MRAADVDSAEVRRHVAGRARTSGLAAGSVAAVGYPGWAVLDAALEPAAAGRLLAVRAVGTALIWALLLVLWRRPVGRRYPGALVFALLAVVQVTTAWMLTEVRHLEFYLLGLSLALHASGLLLVVRPRWTVRLVLCTWAAFLVAVPLDPTPVPARLVVAVVVFLAITSLVVLVAHWHRWQLALREFVARRRLEAEQQRTQELLVRLERLSHEDPLTGLANRRRWDTALATRCSGAREAGTPVAVVLIDLDHFKQVNDRFGHAAGDAALQAVAQLLRSRVRGGDLVARLGGDELALLLPGAELVDAVRLAERVRAEAHALWPAGFSGPGISLSLGVAAAVGDGADPRALLASADAQLYRAKASRDAVSAARSVLA
ncbi:diguanylate cyclase (GGDEF)-like protein [Modestobacter roseus]|uniref:Diguanylate cyclase (GGDEF)-like protein n=1 Tax=Modestobacter roseus TaxID=1181884 RepID=A0A562IVI5_9ACTN|nr:GGDEF domain-containing protein [Modestobacter roseus]TWH74793.1 diguanylate cyclase (GGDEF)-like protein [Modestobacter roseus]